MALVSNQTDIVADFREKSLRHTRVNTDAAVVFDAMPGKVFPACDQQRCRDSGRAGSG